MGNQQGGNYCLQGTPDAAVRPGQRQLHAGGAQLLSAVYRAGGFLCQAA